MLDLFQPGEQRQQKVMLMDNDHEMLDEYDFSQAKRGPVVPTHGNKTRITIRIDTDILDWFREQVNEAGGGSYQANINQALREYMEGRDRKWESLLRQVVREELRLAQEAIS